MRVRAVRQGARQEVDSREPMSEQLFESRQVLGMFFHFLVVFFAGDGPPVSDTRRSRCLRASDSKSLRFCASAAEIAAFKLANASLYFLRLSCAIASRINATGSGWILFSLTAALNACSAPAQSF